MNELENIGFYTLSEERCKKADETTAISRLEILITDACNFNCPYCRGTVHKGNKTFS